MPSPTRRRSLDMADGHGTGVLRRRLQPQRIHRRAELVPRHGPFLGVPEVVRGRKSPVPFYFIGSEQDVDLEAWHGDDPLSHLGDHHEDLRAVRMIKNAGHMMQMERPGETTAAMLEFLEMKKWA